MFDTGNPGLVLTQTHFALFKADVAQRAARVAGTQVVSIAAGVGGNASNLTCILAPALPPAEAAAIFPTLTFTFRGGVTASIPADNYVVSLGQGNVTALCALAGPALASTGAAPYGNGQMRMGAPFFRERFLQIDVQNSVIRISALARGCNFKGI